MNDDGKAKSGALRTGFDRVYQKEIAPHLDEMEARRRRRIKSFYLRIAGFAVVVAVLGGAVYTSELHRTHSFLILVLSFVAILAGYFVISRPVTRQRAEVKDLVIGPVCEFLGDVQYERKPSRHEPDPDRFEDLGVVPSHSRARLEDRFIADCRSCWDAVAM